jgi:hypothetical protein
VTDAASWWLVACWRRARQASGGDPYEITLDGRPLTTWTSRTWWSGGSFDLDGRRFEVHNNVWGDRFDVSASAEDGEQVAAADRVGRRRWNVQADGHRYEFERVSGWSGEQALLDGGGQRVGSIRRVRPFRPDAEADLPGVPLLVQVFALIVVLETWESA